MKSLSLKLSFIAICISLAAHAQVDHKFKFDEIATGTFTKGKVIEQEQMAGSPTGTHGVIEQQSLIEKTQSVEAKIGAAFGVEYKLAGKKNDTIPIELEWVFPSDMTDQKGNRYSSIRYPVDLPANLVNASVYSLDNDYEVLKGTWTLNIYYHDKVIFSRKFDLR